MKKEFQKYELEDFLNDADFCSWVRSERFDLDVFYKDLLKKFPEQKIAFLKARKLIELFDDEKLKTDPARKLQIWEEINKTCQHQRKRIGITFFSRIAAIIIVLLTISSLSLYFISKGNKTELITSANIEDYTETKLILDNGEEVNIQSDQSEIVYEQSGEEIKVNDKLVKKKEQSKEPEVNQVIVPYGKQSKVVLADGTTVWLNAGSQLSYPTSFTGNIREIHLSGEALFDVTSDPAHPFHVITSKIKIQVTGTRFNVTSYANDNTIQTVLLSGKIQARENKHFSKAVELTPGDRIVYNKTSNKLTKDQVDVELFSSWVNGYLVFEDETISEIFKKLERFYNKKIRIEGTTGNAFFTGKLDLAENLESVLNNISFSVPLSIDNQSDVIVIKFKP